MTMDNTSQQHHQHLSQQQQQQQQQQQLSQHQHFAHEKSSGVLSPLENNSDMALTTTNVYNINNNNNNIINDNINTSTMNNNINNSEKSTTKILPQLTSLPVSGKSQLKRSFDVAFLMMPDDRIKQKQAEKQARLIDEQRRYMINYPTDLSPRSQIFQHHQQQQQQQQQQQHQSPTHSEANNIHTDTDLLERRNYTHITLRSPRIYDDPSVLLPSAQSPQSVHTSDFDMQMPLKSAFTKVLSSSSSASSSSVSAASNRRLESPIELAPPLSPDQLSCPSMSPPVAITPPRTNSGNGSLSNGSTGNSSGLPCLNPHIVYQSFRPDYQLNGTFQSVNQVQVLQAQRLKQQFLYRPPVVSTTTSSGATPTSADFLAVSGYAGFPFPSPSHGVSHAFANVGPPELPRMVQNPAAAAILSTLIPPTLASTFTLTAQNVCAKCNISFRMTSDLVYHMRSHHKSEVACDPNRRKREDKLKCPVCQESFRERHHLTRHMTAHQDKESDQPTIIGSASDLHGQSLTTANQNSHGLNSHSRQHMSRVTSATK